MKHVIKGAEPELYRAWLAQANEDWQPSFKILQGKEKAAVKHALLNEQGDICCYCECRVTDANSHIEHFRPQSDPDANPLDYSNMLCSCLKETEEGQPRHCGVLKDNWFDEQLLISPFDERCETRFAFLGDGSILPASQGDAAAMETIKRLGLDIAKLRAMRARAIEPFIDDQLSPQELSAFVAGYLSRDVNGQFGAFWTTVRFLFAG